MKIYSVSKIIRFKSTKAKKKKNGTGGDLTYHLHHIVVILFKK